MHIIISRLKPKEIKKSHHDFGEIFANFENFCTPFYHIVWIPRILEKSQTEPLKVNEANSLGGYFVFAYIHNKNVVWMFFLKHFHRKPFLYAYWHFPDISSYVWRFYSLYLEIFFTTRPVTLVSNEIFSRVTEVFHHG